MFHSLTRACVLAIVSLSLTSCLGPNKPQPQNQKKTIPVHGEVTVDGKAGHGVRIYFSPKAGPDTANPTATTATAGEDGKFEAGTYSSNDGAPAGEYALTFEWIDPTKPIRLLGGGGPPPDQFNGKYIDIKKSTHSVTVPEGATEVEVPRIELTTK
jgi:hypothetical protein